MEMNLKTLPENPGNDKRQRDSGVESKVDKKE